MKVYAELPVARARRVLTDVAAIASLAAVILVAEGVHRLVSSLSTLREAIEEAGLTMAGSLRWAPHAVGQTPVVGGPWVCH